MVDEQYKANLRITINNNESVSMCKMSCTKNSWQFNKIFKGKVDNSGQQFCMESYK